MREVVLAHCWTGSPEQAWYPAFRDSLARDGWLVSIPALPDTHSPDPAAWLKTFREAVGVPHADLVLVGHSLGCATILRYLESLPATTCIAGVVLVAPFSEALGIAQVDAFHEGGFDWKKLRARPEPKKALFGTEDPYLRERLSIERECFERELGADVVFITGGGHFSPASGCRELPLAAALVHDCLARRG